MARPREERLNAVRCVLDKFDETAIRLADIPRFVDWLNVNGYFDVPASIHHHGTQSGDLFEHSMLVAEILADYTKKGLIEWQGPCSPWIVGLFHDLCKMDDYIRDANGGWKRKPTPLIKGHGDKSVILLSRFLTLTEEEILCIRYHMGAYETDNWEQYDLAIRKYPSVLYTHTADMVANRVWDIWRGL